MADVSARIESDRMPWAIDGDNALSSLSERIETIPAGPWSPEHESLLESFDTDVVRIIAALDRPISLNAVLSNVLRVNRMPLETFERIQAKLGDLVTSGQLEAVGDEFFDLGHSASQEGEHNARLYILPAPAESVDVEEVEDESAEDASEELDRDDELTSDQFDSEGEEVDDSAANEELIGATDEVVDDELAVEEVEEDADEDGEIWSEAEGVEVSEDGDLEDLAEPIDGRLTLLSKLEEDENYTRTPLAKPTKRKAPTKNLSSQDRAPAEDDNREKVYLPEEPEAREIAKNVRDYVLGISELNIAIEDLSDHGPIYRGCQVAMDDTGYRLDGCQQRLEQISEMLSKDEKESSSLPATSKDLGTWYEKRELGNCRGVDPVLFYPERGASTRESKEVCRGCIICEDCLDFAITNGEKFGIWGGKSERERRRIRRQRSLAKKQQEEQVEQIASGGTA